MAIFFRDFWEKYAEEDRWYDLEEIGRKFEELNPDQPKISHSGDLLGGMRRVSRDMVKAGVIESQRTMGRGSWKNVFRKKPQPQQGEVRIGPLVTWEGIKGDPKE
jgi:hypothetical protein